MKIEKIYFSEVSRYLINNNKDAQKAFSEVKFSILNNITCGYDCFVLNSIHKNGNGVVPIKEKCYQILEDMYHWYREKPLMYFYNDVKKGGPIDIYKEFITKNSLFRVGVEFETGNISSAHRSMNKLHVGIIKNELDLAMLMMPVQKMSFYLTDRVSNYEELAPYFVLLENVPFIIFGFDADRYSPLVPCLPKGKDGMSHRVIRKWQSN